MKFSKKIKRVLQGRLLSHPLHPVIVHFPIGFWTLSFIFDLFSGLSSDVELSHLLWRASAWCICAGLIACVPAVITGLAEFSDLPKRSHAKAYGWAHLIANCLLIVGYAVELVIRDLAHTDLRITILSGVLFGLLGLSGYLGGKLVYRYRVGVRSRENPQRDVSPDDHLVWPME